MKKTIEDHLMAIKKIEAELRDQNMQAKNNIEAMHFHCGGEYDANGNLILNREAAILWFANGRHLKNYSSIDTL